MSKKIESLARRAGFDPRKWEPRDTDQGLLKRIARNNRPPEANTRKNGPSDVNFLYTDGEFDYGIQEINEVLEEGPYTVLARRDPSGAIQYSVVDCRIWFIEDIKTVVTRALDWFTMNDRGTNNG